MAEAEARSEVENEERQAKEEENEEEEEQSGYKVLRTPHEITAALEHLENKIIFLKHGVEEPKHLNEVEKLGASTR